MGRHKGRKPFYNSPIYTCWRNMRRRCKSLASNNKPYYLDKGITVCKEWGSFEVFFKDMYPSWKEGLTLDRIDNNLGYCKENCRWATRSIQSQNRNGYGVSKYPGVSKLNNKWRARVFINNAHKHLGSYATENEAIEAVKKWKISNV